MSRRATSFSSSRSRRRKVGRRQSVLASKHVWRARSGLILLLVLAVILLGLSRGDHAISRWMHGVAGDASAPLIGWLSAPARWIEGHSDAAEEKLRSAHDERLKWQNIALKLEAENASLRRLLSVQEEPSYRSITAKISSNFGDAYSRHFTINAGRMEGVKRFAAVVSPQGLVGRVLEVGEHSARILSVEDVDSRLPVRSEWARETGIAKGRGNDTLSVAFAPEESKMVVGERLVTLGDDAAGFPANIVVGEVTEMQEGKIAVKSYVDWPRLEYVKIMLPTAGSVGAAHGQ